MQNLVFTQLSIPEIQNLIKEVSQEVLKEYFSDYSFKVEPPKPEPSLFLTKPESAKLINCSVSTIDNWRRRGWLKRYYVGSSVRFKRSELISIIENKKAGNKNEAIHGR